jgi:uncharacterized YigZ family protein
LDFNIIALSTIIDKYLTIRVVSTGIYKDKGSKFLAFAYPVKEENEIKDIVDKLKKEYFDARHHCYAWRLGAEKLAFRANDDGEPSGTAGKPILGQMIANDLTNILVVVVRYFGGTLLGTSGLINAYRAATADVIANAQIIESFVLLTCKLEFGYEQMNAVMKIVKDQELDCFDQIFEMVCSLKVRIKLGNAESLVSKFAAIEGVDVQTLGVE